MKYLLLTCLFCLLLALMPSCCWKKQLKRCAICDTPIETISLTSDYEPTQDSIDFD